MEIQKVKISDLPVTEDLNGLKTLGTTAENTSKAAELTFIADAATSANEAATNANQAAENANTSAANADAKAEAAQKAANNATASANQADQAAVNANTATTRATAAAEKAENAADVAIGVVNEAQQATANANQAAQSANEAATNANQAAASANDAATEAHTQAEYAKTQGDYAKSEGDRVLAEKGQPGGLAELDESGRVPSSQLPSYVDDVVEYPSRSDFPATGESGKIYVATDTNLAYRWGGTEYVEISPSLALGTTAETAGRGDWTQAAYNHSLIKDGSNPHKTTFASLPDKPTALPPGGNAGGDLTGTYPNPTIGAGKVTTAKIADGAVIAAKLAEQYIVNRGAVSDLNNATTYGFYTYDTTTQNAPTSYGSVIVVEGTGREANWVQLALGYSSGDVNPSIFIRLRQSYTVWGPWVKVWNSNNFNPDSKLSYSEFGGDLDAINTSGLYRLLSGCTNTPNSGSSQGGHIIHTKWDTNAAHQLYFEYYGSMFYRYKHGGEWSDWKRVWTEFEFNPDNYLPLSGNKMITGDFQLKDGVAVRDAAGRSVVGLLDVAGDGVCVAVGNSAKKTRIITPDDTPVYRNDSKGAYRIYDSSNFNPGNYLLLSGGTMTGDITFGSNGRSLRGSDGGNIAGVLYDTPNARYVTAIGTGSRRLILVSPDSIYRGAGGVAENYMIYDSSNLGNATTSKAGLMSAADKTKLDGLSGGGLNIPASGEVAISGWTYNGKQVYAQRWTGEFTGVTKNLTTIEGLSAILMKGGTLFLYGSQSNSVGLGSSQWNQTTGDITRISDLQYNLLTGSVTVAAWYGGTSSPTTVNWSYEVWAAYTK